jgi:hypothetical protein
MRSMPSQSKPNGAILVPPDIFNTSHRAAIVDATIRHR